MQNELLAPPDDRAIAGEVTNVVSVANALVVADNPQLAIAGDILRRIKGVRQQVAETFDEPAKAAFAAHKAIVAARKKHDDPLAAAESTIKRKVGAYQDEQERIRRQEEARLRDEARKAEEERQLAEAAALEQEGRTEEAEAVVSEPVRTPVIVVPTAVPKIEGVSSRQDWKWRIVNGAVIPREYLILDDKKVGSIVRAMKDRTNIPGIEAYPVTVTSVRA